MLPTSRKTSFVAMGVDTAGGAAGATVQASSSEASAAPPSSHALRRIRVRRVNPDSERCVPGCEDSCDVDLSPYSRGFIVPLGRLRRGQGLANGGGHYLGRAAPVC